MKYLFSRRESEKAPLSDIYGDVETVEKIFNLFIATMTFGMVAGIFIVLTTNNVSAAGILASGILLVLLTACLVQRKQFEAAASFIAVTFLLLNTALATRGLGIHHISNYAYPAILIIASLVTRRRTMILLTLLTIICLAWLVFGEIWGLYVPGVLVRSVPGDFLSASVIVVSTAVMVYRLTNTLFKSFSRLQKEIAERKAAEENLRQREAILEAATFAAEQFLKASNWRENINPILERLGKTIHATHAYLFEHHPGPENVMVDSMRYEWTAPGYVSDLGNPEFQNTPLSETGFEQYHQTLASGQPFVGNTATFLPAERGHFNSLGIKSILEMPLFVDGQWWGTVGFDDVEREREWNIAELDVLKIAVGILCTAIQREKAYSAVHESERIYRQAIEAAGAVPYYRDFRDDRYGFIGDGIERITGYKPEEFTPQMLRNIQKEIIPRGAATGLPIEEAIRLARAGGIREWQSDVCVIARNGEERWLGDSAIELFDDSETLYASIGILQDITDRKQAELSLKKHESLLEAITFAAEQFMKTADWRENIDDVLERLGREFDASDAYLFQRHRGKDEEILSSMIYEWTAPGLPSDLTSPAFQNMPPKPMGFERLYHILDSGEPLVGSASFFTPEEKEYLHSINVASMLEIRVLVNGKHWGTFGVDDVAHEREWTPMEVDVIRVAAGVLGAAIERQLNDDALKRELAERRRAELALRLSEEKFSKAFHSTPVLMTIENEENRFVEVNEAFTNALGLSPRDVIGHTASELGMFQDPKDVYALRQAYQEKGFLKDFEIQFHRKNDETGVALLSTERFTVEDTEFTLTSGLDITDRKRAEMERERLIADLRLKNAESETLRETTAIVASTLDVSEAVQRILEQLKRVIDYDSASVWLYHGNTAHLMGGAGLPQLSDRDTMYEVNETEPDYIFWTQDLPYILLEDIQEHYPQFPDFLHGWLAIPLKARGKLNGFIALDGYKPGKFTERDASLALTYARQVSIALENARLFSDLQKQLSERQKLINELGSKNNELESFTYTVSHDLKSPLVTINGFLGYLERDAASGNTERLKRDVQRIQDAVRKMQNLLNDLLELSRIGRIMNTPQSTPFEELVREAEENVHGRLEAGGITIQIHPSLPAVHGDRPRLVEVLQNLIENAVKYMGDQPEPIIEIGRSGEENGQPVFFVRDNGMGIEPEHHERIFGLFNKLDAKSEGTGVGLALVKRIVEVHGGRVWLESAPGQGSTFYFTLPKP